LPRTPPKPPFRTGATVPSLVDEAQVSSLINLAARLTSKAARIRLGSIGAWPGQIPILLWLLEKDGMIQKELVQLASIEQPSVAEHLDRMEREGLLFRQQAADDKRTYRIFLTDKAKAMSGELLHELNAGARIFTAGIPKGDLEVFDRVIRQIIVRLDQFIRSRAKKSDRAASAPAARGRKALPPGKVRPKISSSRATR
jgi:MarR family transcriptional regulator for hemolysin